MKYTYLMLMLCSFAGPLIMSFEKKIRFAKNFRKVAIGSTVVAIPFLIWDEIFTQMGIWAFNSQYITGIKLFSLPIEEIMFFFVIPFACLFIYENVNYLTRKILLSNLGTIMYWLHVIILPFLAFSGNFKWYTSVTFVALTLSLIIVSSIKRMHYMGKFFLAYIVCLLPFLIINGVLTYLPVVTYNDAENLAFRIFTIPIEDFFYGELLILWNVFLYKK